MHHDERLAEGPQHLPPQHVEELGRRGAVDHLDVVLRAQPEEPLDPGARVLGALTLVAVGQQHREPAHALPLGLGTGDELVDDDLGAIGEVTELGLPDHEPARVGTGHAVLESHHAHLAERAVHQLDGRLLGAQVVERHVGRTRLHIEQHRVPVAEGTSHAVLPAEPDRDLLEQKAAVGEVLGAAPVDVVALVHHARRSSSSLATRGWGEKSEGSRLRASARVLSVSAFTRVSAVQSSPAQPNPDQAPPKAKTFCRGIRSRAEVSARSSSAWTLFRMASTRASSARPASTSRRW